MKTLAPMGGQTPHPPKNGGEHATPGQVLPYPGQPFDGKLGDRTKYLGGSDAAVRSAAVYAVWNIARNHPEYKGDNVKAILKRVLTMFDGEDAR